MSFLHLKLHFDQFGIIDQILCGCTKDVYLDSACILTAIFFVEHREGNTEVSVKESSLLDINVFEKTSPLAIVHLTKGSEKSVKGLFLCAEIVSVCIVLTLRLSSELL